jgi:hypothetical protein
MSDSMSDNNIESRVEAGPQPTDLGLAEAAAAYGHQQARSRGLESRTDEYWEVADIGAAAARAALLDQGLGDTVRVGEATAETWAKVRILARPLSHDRGEAGYQDGSTNAGTYLGGQK